MALEAIAEVLETQADGTRLSAGTAFAVTPSLALTAFHVVGDRETGVARANPLVLRFRRLREDQRSEPVEFAASYRDGDSEIDAAVLKLEKALPDDLLPIALSSEAEAGESFVSGGHPRLDGPDVSYIHGTVVAPRTSIFHGLPAIQIHSEEAGDRMPLQGMSGAPVLVACGAKRAAIGLIRWNPTRADDEEALAVGGTVYACPAYAIVKRWPEFQVCLASRSALADLAHFPFPKVSGADCYDLGVSRSEYLDQYRARGEDPPYVPRDLDHELTEALKSDTFVVLAGEAKAGKTRTAFEALRQVSPSTPMIVPYEAESLQKIIEMVRDLADYQAPAVLWLDDLDRFLNKGTLTPRLVDIALRELGMRIVATMRSRELIRWKGLNDVIARDGQQVLERAHIIKLEDFISPQEEKQTRALYPDLKLGRGLGESLIAGPELKQRYDFGGRPMVAAVRAANDWRRTGFTVPIRRSDLLDLFKFHCEDLAPAEDPTEEVFTAALKDARTPVTHYIALLKLDKSQPAGAEEAYSLEDYLGDYLEKKGYPMMEEAWKLALGRLRSEHDCFAVGFAAYERKRPDVAEAAWTAGYSSLPCATDLGFLLLQQGRLGEAEKAYREAIRLNPLEPGGHTNLGLVFLRQGRFEEAEAAHREAIRLDPLDAGAHYNLGVALTQQTRSQEAEAAFREVIRLNPADPHAHYRLGVLLAGRGRVEEAEQVLSEAIRLSPLDSDSHYWLGIALTKQNRLQEAEAAYRETIRLNPQDSAAHYNLGVLLTRQNRAAEAEAAFREAIRLNPLDSAAHYNLAVILDCQVFLAAEAEAAYREAIRLNPRDSAAHYNLGILLIAQNRLAEAESAFREVILLDPQDSAAQCYLGMLLASQGRAPEAESAFREVIRLNPLNSAAHSYLGRLLAQQGRATEAEAAFRESLRLNPRDADARSRLDRLLAAQDRKQESATPRQP